MDADDGVARVELPGEQALLFQALKDATDLRRQTPDLVLEFRRHLVPGALFGSHLQHRFQVAHLRGQVLVVLKTALQAAVPGAHLLSVTLVVPVVRGAHRLLEGGDIGFQRGGVKDSPLPK